METLPYLAVSVLALFLSACSGSGATLGETDGQDPSQFGSGGTFGQPIGSGTGASTGVNPLPGSGGALGSGGGTGGGLGTGGGGQLGSCETAECGTGTCQTATGTYACSCPFGWSGADCLTPVNGCDDSPCQNGTCSNLDGGGYACACSAGFAGPNCDLNIDDCAAAPCANGTCTDGVNAFTCACAPGFSGPTCSTNINECAGSPCANGTCQDGTNSFSCACSFGWAGDLCDQPVSGCKDSPCARGTCTDTGPGAYSCSCPAGWSGQNCSVCASNYVLEGGNCISQKQVACRATTPTNATSTPGQVTITYTTAGGWSTPLACAFTCNAGWTGGSCGTSVNDCAGNTCQNGSSCVDGHQSYTCSCPAGYSGDRCQTNVDNCASNPCAHGSCTDGVNSYTCSCQTGWSGTNCDQCATNYTFETGTCIRQKQVACTNAAPANATSTPGSVTVTYTTAGGWSTPAACAFTCNAGWTGGSCGTSVNDCAGNTCQNGSTCVDGHQSYTCSCPAGYSGNRCQTNINDCVSHQCQQGTCVDGVNTYTCNCNPGYSGNRCQTNINDCVGHACVNGTCVDGVDTYSCSCTGTWEGDLCDEAPSCSCSSGQTCDATDTCVDLGTIDNFASCDSNIVEIEGRNGKWYFYQGSGVSCAQSPCSGASTPPWGGSCGAWIRGGQSSQTNAYAGMGLGLNEAGTTYNACNYTAISVTYSSDQQVRMYLKWGNTGQSGTRASVLLPATSGTQTQVVNLSSFTGLNCTNLTEVQFEPSDVSGFGIVVSGVKFTGGGCTQGATRCGTGGGLEVCSSNTWQSSSCQNGQHCESNRCVSDNATPVSIHGHLAVNGRQVVDESGNPVQLKGVSTHWLNFEPDGYALNLTNLVWMRDNWNLSVIRAAMGTEEAGGYLTSTANKNAMLSQIETIIDNAVSAGVYVIIDWHSHYAHNQTSSAQAFFTDIATRYGYLPNVIFEVYNEPLNVSWNSVLKPYHQTIVNAIRAADSDNNDNLIVLGTPNWDQDVDVVNNVSARVTGTNLAYTLHFYACTHGETELAKARSAIAAGVPLFVTEWGAMEANGGINGTAYCASTADDWHDLMDEHLISWAAWKLDDCDWEIQQRGVADTSCMLKLNAPLSGPWPANQLNGHGPYVVDKMKY